MLLAFPSGKKTLDIPSSVTSVAPSAFEFCGELTSVALPATLLPLWEKFEPHGLNAENITICDGAMDICDGAFRYCDSLKSLTIPNGVTNIGESAFVYCRNLSAITIPESVRSIGCSSFSDCNSLTNVDFEGAPPSGLVDASIGQDTAIRYNIDYEDEWLPVIAECGFTNATAYDPYPLVPPEWDPIPMGDAMVVYAVVSNRHEKTKIDADGSMLAAFAEDGECRGVAEIEDGPGGSRFFQLTVGYADVDEEFALKAWDASNGELVELSTRIAVDENGVIGAIRNPLVLCYGTTEVSITLKEGWNWVSTPVSPETPNVGDVLADATFANDDMIKSAGKVATYFNGVWYPSSFKLEAGSAYMVHKGTGGSEDVTIEGVKVDPQIAVKAGWNWIGPTMLSTQAVACLSHSNGFAENDIIHNVSKSATYCEGQWYSDAFQLIPGVGYKAKLGNAGTLAFGTYPAAAIRSLFSSAKKMATASVAVRVTAKCAKPIWDPVVQKDTLVAYLQITNEFSRTRFESLGSTLAAFAADGECRGVVEVDRGPAGEIYQLPIGVKSSTEGGFKLKLWDAASESAYDIEGTVDGNKSGVVGKILQPVVLTADVLSGDPIPEMTVPTADLVQTVMERAADAKLAAAITNEAQYVEFRNWANSAKESDSESPVGAAKVMAASNAWLSYALGSETLIENAPDDKDLTVEEFEPSSEAGKFDFTVSVEGVAVGDDAQKENLKQVFGLEGSATLNPNGFSSENVDIAFGTPKDGKVRFTAGPKNTKADTFFMKVKVNP